MVLVELLDKVGSKGSLIQMAGNFRIRNFPLEMDPKKPLNCAHEVHG